jgi:hypothetical protein
LERINLYHDVFSTQLADKDFEFTNDNIVDCIFNFVLKKNNFILTYGE